MVCVGAAAAVIIPRQGRDQHGVVLLAGIQQGHQQLVGTVLALLIRQYRLPFDVEVALRVPSPLAEGTILSPREIKTGVKQLDGDAQVGLLLVGLQRF